MTTFKYSPHTWPMRSAPRATVSLRRRRNPRRQLAVPHFDRAFEGGNVCHSDRCSSASPTLRFSGGAKRRPLQPVVRPALFVLRVPERRRQRLRRVSCAPHVVMGEDRENKRLRFEETSQVAQGEPELQQPVLIDEHLRVLRFK